MPEDSTQPSSLAYRKAKDGIWNGDVPEKYARLLPYVRGHSVLEIGAAEGVLSLLLSRERAVERVTALELRDYRHQEGLKLQARWRALGYDVARCTMVCDDIRNRFDLLESIDTLVAVRAIYYLREDAPRVLMHAFPHARRVVLCGNRGRQSKYRSSPGSETFNFLSSIEGMRALLVQAGYRVEEVLEEGDPVVVGCH